MKIEYVCWEKLKTDDGQMHVHAIFFSRTCMRPSSAGPMVASAVEPPSVDMKTTSAVNVTSTIFLVPNSLLYFNLEENDFMKILQTS